MKTIIAGTDFSQSSLNACQYAAFLAQILNCKLVLFNLFEAPIMHSNTGLYGISYTSQRLLSEKNIDHLTIELQKHFPKVKISPFVTSGSFRQELENFTKIHQVEAAVMGLEAKTQIAKFIYGSHGLNIIGKIKTPVIIVPKNYKEHHLSKVLLAVDNNEKLQNASFEDFENFLSQSKARLNVLHVRTKEEVFDPLLRELKINGEKKPIESIQAKDLQRGIKKYCLEGNIDLITILSKKHGAFYNLFSESNTQRVAFTAKVPVMALHD